MQQRYRVLLYMILLAGLIYQNPATAQQPETIAPTVHADCVTVERLMDIGTAPDRLIEGGGRLAENSAVQADITALDAGDRWLLAVPYATTLTVDIEATVPVQVEVLSRLDTIFAETVSDAGTLSIDVPTAGYYTLVVRREDITAQEVVGRYNLSISGALAEPIALDQPINVTVTGENQAQRWLFYNRFVSGQDEARLNLNLTNDVPVQVRLLDASGNPVLDQQVVAGTGLPDVIRLSASGYFTLEVISQAASGSYSFTLTTPQNDPTRIARLDQVVQPRWEQVASPPSLLPDSGFIPVIVNENLQLALPPDLVSNIVVGPSVRLSFSEEDSLRFVQSSASELRLLDGDLNIQLANGGTIYVQDYPWQGELADDSSSFSTLSLPSGQEVRVDWANAAGMWVLPDCIGIKLQTGQKLIAEGQTLGARPDPRLGGFPINVTGAVEYTLNVDWIGIDRILATDNTVTLNFDNGAHTLITDRTTLNVRRETGDTTITQTVLADGQPYLTTDWENIQRIASVGDQTVIQVLDAREQIERSGRVLRNMETQSAVMMLRWQDNSESLLLPESEDFIQLEIPAAPVSYSSTALPGEAQYLPANQNNTGQECYPVNTALDLNCAPNGLVNPANGNLSLAVTDLYARGYRVDLALSRTYNSLNAQLDSPFGYGWNTDYWLDFDVPYNNSEAAPQSRLIEESHDYRMALDLRQAFRGIVIFTTGSGSHHVFRGSAAGNSLTSDTLPGWRIEARLNVLSDSWKLYRSDGLVYEFDRAGRLLSLSHPHGGALTISRQQPYPSAIYHILDDVGRKLVLEYDADQHITRSQLYDPAEALSSETTYTYENGRLVAVTYDDGSTATYAYDDAGRLVSHTDPRAPIATTLVYTYDEAGRVISIAESADAPPYRSYAYSGDANFVTVVTDEWGRETQWRYNVTDDPRTAYQIAGRTFPGQAEITFQYDQNSQVLGGIRYPGYILGVNRTENGELTFLSNLNAFFEYRAEYQNVRMGAQTVALLSQYQVGGRVQGSYAYDNEGHLLSFTNPDGVVTTVVERHPDFGLPTLLTVTYSTQAEEPVEETVTLTYNELGYLSSRTDPRGTTRYTWDMAGRLTGYTDPLERAYTITYVNDANGQCIKVTDPLASETTSCYDLRQNLIEKRTNSGEAILEQTRYTYDQWDRLIEERQTWAEGDLVTRYAYLSGLSAGTWRLEVTDPYGLTVTTEYDIQNRVVREIDTLGRETTYRYEDQNVRMTDPNGVVTVLEYNLANQLCAVNHDEIEWQLFYDPQGTRCNEPRREVSRIVIPNRLDISFEAYDSSGRLEQLSYRVLRPGDDNPGTLAAPDPTTIRYDYDERGLPTLMQQGQGSNSTATYQWDATGQRISTMTSTNADGTTQQVTATYDVLDRLVSMQTAEGTLSYTYTDLPDQHVLQVNVAFNDADGTAQNWRLIYNPLGNLVEWENQDQVITRYEYDQVSWLHRVLVNERVDTEYTYNAAGLVTSITNREGRTRRFVYDNKAQLTTARDFNNVVTVYTYDQTGNLSTITDALGNTTTYLYDTRNRLVNIINPVGRNQSFDWAEAQLGQLTYSDNNATINYYFDLFGKLWQVRDAEDIQHFFRYAPSGELTGLQQGALNLNLGYNLDGLLTTLSDGQNWNWLFRYDNQGRLIERQDPNTNLITFNYDQLGRLTNLNLPNSDPTYERQFDYPTPGTINMLVGSFQSQMLYDDFYRLTEYSLTDQASPTPETFTTRYAYSEDESYTITDPFGVERVYTYAGLTGLDQEVFLTVSEGSRQWLYVLNARGELVSIARLDQIGEAVYEQVEQISYDPLGQPIRYVDAEGNLYGFTYDTAGNLRTIQNPDGSSYSYDYDDLHRLTRITNSGNQVISLGYNTLSQLENIRLDNTTLESYGYNPLGALTSRTNTAGTTAYTYDNAGRVTGWSSEGGLNVALTYTAGAFDEIQAIQQGDAATQPPTQYTYDALGRVTEATTGPFGQAFTLDALGRVDNWLHMQTAEQWDYTYGEDGLSYTLSIGSGDRQLQFTLDENRRLQQMVANEEPITVSYSLRNETELDVELAWGDGYTSQVRFDRLGHITRVVHDRQGDISFNRAAYTYTLNYFGLPQSADETVHDVFLGYDSAYRPLTTRWLYTGPDRTRQRDSIEYAFTLTYDDLGNRRTQLEQDLDGNQRLIRYRYDDTLLRERTGDSATIGGAALIIGLSLALVSRKRKVMIAALLVVPMIALIAAGLSAQQPPEPTGVEYTYNSAGNLIMLVDTNAPAEQNTTRFEYDGYGRLRLITYPDASVSEFTYDAFGRLITWQKPGVGQIAYRYDGERLTEIVRNNQANLLLNVEDMPLLLVENSESTWHLFDGQDILRQQFVETHTQSFAVNEADYFGVRLDLLADEAITIDLPIFDGMLYDPASGLYPGLDGRAYEPRAGRYLQPDPLGPDASGNLYNYRFERAQLMVQDREALAYMEGLAALMAAQSQPEYLTAADVLPQHLPDFNFAWVDNGLAALQTFNAGSFQQSQAVADLTHWLAYQYNPAGVTVNAQGQFAILDANNPQWDQSGVLPPALLNSDFELAGLQPVDVLATVGAATLPDAPQWGDPNNWRPLDNWQLATTAPRPVTGSRAPGAALTTFAYPLTDLQGYDGLMTALENLPVQPAEAWLAEIDTQTLPQAPALLPETAEGWLDEWFTTDTFPTWELLREIYDLPDVPGNRGFSINLEE